MKNRIVKLAAVAIVGCYVLSVLLGYYMHTNKTPVLQPGLTGYSYWNHCKKELKGLKS